MKKSLQLLFFIFFVNLSQFALHAQCGYAGNCGDYIPYDCSELEAYEVLVGLKYEGDDSLYYLTYIENGETAGIDLVQGRNTFYNLANLNNCPPEPVIEYLSFKTVCMDAVMSCFIPFAYPGSIFSCYFECPNDIHFWFPPEPLDANCNDITIDFFYDSPSPIASFHISYITIIDFSAYLDANAWLGGAYNNEGMTTQLNSEFLLPITQPYNQSPWNYGGSEGIGIFSLFPGNITDWVLLELRSADDVNTIVARRAALIRNTGKIVDTDGCASVSFSADTNQPYYIALRHRNHLSVISANPVFFPLDEPFDFTNPENVMNGNTQMILLDNEAYALKPGDVNANGTITHADFNAYKQQTAVSNSYNKADCNLDGDVNLIDFNFIRQNTSSIGVSDIRY